MTFRWRRRNVSVAPGGTVLRTTSVWPTVPRFGAPASRYGPDHLRWSGVALEYSYLKDSTNRSSLPAAKDGEIVNICVRSPFGRQLVDGSVAGSAPVRPAASGADGPRWRAFLRDPKARRTCRVPAGDRATRTRSRSQ